MKVGQNIIIYFDDGEKIARKDGKITSVDQEFIELDNTNIISKSRIIRAEVVTDE